MNDCLKAKVAKVERTKVERTHGTKGESALQRVDMGPIEANDQG